MPHASSVTQKNCLICNKEFIKNSSTHKYCSLICAKKSIKLWYIKHKDSVILKCKTYYKLNKHKIINYHKEYYQKNRIKIKEKTRKIVFKVCPECKKSFVINKKNRKYCSFFCYDKFFKKYQTSYNKNYQTINKKYLFEQARKYQLIPKNKLVKNLRNRISKVLKGINKSALTMKLIGCSIEQLKQHLESKFQLGMTWDNYGKWHVDHIKPCASFDLTKVEEQKTCFNYSNLQPLWARDNISKGIKQW